MNLYLYHNSDQKTSPAYTLKLQNQYKTTFFSPTVIIDFSFDRQRFLLESAIDGLHCNNPRNNFLGKTISA